MTVALESGDRELARQIARRAHDQGWVGAVELWGQHGGALELAHVVAEMDDDQRRRRRGPTAGAMRWSV
jgi:hypothetical protein